MQSSDVRDVGRKYSLWSGFRDELVATAMTLTLLVLGSFVLTEWLIFKPPAEEVVEETTPQEVPQESQTLGVQDIEATTVLPTPTVTQSSTATEGAVVFSEVPYGEDGDYDFVGYSISFRNPKIVFDAQTNSRRKLMVTVWIKNKNVVEGIETRLVASIIKDGKVIVPAASLHVPQPRRLNVGEEVSFAATLSLIEATDVREIKYLPGNELVEASHFLYP